MAETPKNILIVEDEPAIRNALTAILSSAGFKATGAKDGIEGLSMAERNHFDLILLDAVMPRIDGITMFKIVRNTIWGSDIPIILLTNLSPDDEKLSIVKKDRSSRCLGKTDVNINTVLNQINEIFQSRESCKKEKVEFSKNILRIKEI